MIKLTKKNNLAFHKRTSSLQHVTYLSQPLFHPAGMLTIFVVCVLQAYLVLENSDTLDRA